MAEITFDKFWRGMSPTSLYAKPGECAYIEGIDATQNVSRVTNLSPWALDFLTDGNDMETFFTATGVITSKAWYAGEGGQIYHSDSDDNIPDKQLTKTTTVTGSTSIKGGIFLLQKGSGYTVVVHRMNEDNASLGSTSKFQEDLFISDTVGGNSSTDDHYINSFGENSIVVIKGAQIYVLLVGVDALDDDKGALTLDKSFSLGRTVAGVSTTTDFLKIYTKDGRILMYNKSFTLVSETQTGELLFDVVTSNNRDYVIGEEGAYYVEGNNLVPIYKDGNKGLYRISSQAQIFEWRQNVYILIEIDNDKKILRIGTDNAGFPEALTILPTLDSLGNAVTSIYGVGGRFTLSAGMNVTTTGKGVYTLNGSSTFAKGTLITQKFNAGSSVLVKAISEIIISGKFNDGSTIETIINDDQASTPITLNNADNKNELIRTTELNAEFLDVSFKVVLKGNDQLYGIKLKYNGEKQ